MLVEWPFVYFRYLGVIALLILSGCAAVAVPTPTATLTSAKPVLDLSRVAVELTATTVRATATGAGTPTPAAPPIPTPLLSATAPAAATSVPSAPDAWQNLARLEQALDDANTGVALEALASPLPAEVADLVALRRAEVAMAIGGAETARRALADPAIVATSNRVIALRAAEVAQVAGDWALAGRLFLRAADLVAWRAVKQEASLRAALAFARGGNFGRAIGILRQSDARLRSDFAELVLAEAQPAQIATLDRAVLAFLAGRRTNAKALIETALSEGAGAREAEARSMLAELTAATPVPGPWARALAENNVEAFARFRAENPGDARAADAYFREGLAHFLADRQADARRVWSAALASESTSAGRARLLYWRARSAEEAGNTVEAQGGFDQASRTRPTSYYAVRAADRLAGHRGWPSGGTRIPPPIFTETARAAALRWVEGWTQVPAEDRVRALLRPKALSDLAVRRMGAAELDQSIETVADPRVLLALGHFAEENGYHHAAARAGARLARISPAVSPLDAPVGILSLAYPRGYADQTVLAGQRHDVGPYLLLALIRQESLFDERALSPSGARGLTQVMPATGAEIATAARVADFQELRLEEPALSIDFGARYLAVQLTAFPGDVFRAVAAYNAGGGAVRRWGIASADPDIFVELIPVAEPQAYVRALYLHHAAYRALDRLTAVAS